MTNLKKIFLLLVVTVLLGASVVFATNDDTIVITDSNTINTVNTTNTTDTPNTITTINTVGNTTGNTSTYNVTQNLPQTGANDYAMILIIAIFAVSAVYAYKKIRDYKNI